MLFRNNNNGSMISVEFPVVGSICFSKLFFLGQCFFGVSVFLGSVFFGVSGF